MSAFMLARRKVVADWRIRTSLSRKVPSRSPQRFAFPLPLCFILLLLTLTTVAQAQSLTSISVLIPSPTGGSYVSGTVTLDAPAPSGGINVLLSSDHANVASVPASVTVSSGQTQGYFTVTTYPVSVPTALTLTAGYGGVNKTAPMTVYPPQVTALGFSPDTLVGGNTTQGYLQLDGPAPTGGAYYNVNSSNAQAAVVSSAVFVPSGASSITFLVQTSTVNYPTLVTFSAPNSSLTADLHLQPTNLHVIGLLPPNIVQLAWDALPVSQYHLYRAVYPPTSNSSWTLVANLPAGTLTYNDAYAFVPGTDYVYVLKGDPAYNGAGGQDGFGYQTTLYSSDIVEPYFVPTTANQTVDSRLDLRYATNVFLDHNFGTTAFRGGLFVGSAGDGSKVGRSFARFPLDTQPTHLLPSFRVGNVSAYLTTAYTNGQNPVQMQVGCLPLASNLWDPMSLVWSNAPAVNPSAATSVANVAFDPTAPQSQWVSWLMPETLKTAVLNQTPLSVGWASLAEGASGWAYFAKKEFDATKAPTACYAWCGPTVVSLSLSPSNLATGAGSGSSTATVNINGLGSGDSVPLYIWYEINNNPQINPNAGPCNVSCPSSMTATGMNRTFTIQAGAPLGNAASVRIYVSLFPQNTYPANSYFRWYASAVLTINATGNAGGGDNPAGPAGPAGPGG